MRIAPTNRADSAKTHSPMSAAGRLRAVIVPAGSAGGTASTARARLAMVRRQVACSELHAIRRLRWRRPLPNGGDEATTMVLASRSCRP